VLVESPLKFGLTPFRMPAIDSATSPIDSTSTTHRWRWTIRPQPASITTSIQSLNPPYAQSPYEQGHAAVTEDRAWPGLAASVEAPIFRVSAHVSTATAWCQGGRRPWWP